MLSPAIHLPSGKIRKVSEDTVNALWNELRYAVRSFSRRPGFFAACVGTLALAIGANTAIFTVVNAALLHPLPFKDPGQLVLLWQADSKQGIDHFAVSLPYFDGWREQNQVFEEVAAFSGQNFDLTGRSAPERVSGTLVSTNFFHLLGIQPVLGRIFLPEEDEPNRLNVAVISYELWQRRFGGERAIGGQILTTDTASYRIVGVMPPNFRFLASADLWIPLGKKAESLHIPSNFPSKVLATIAPLNVVARLKPHVALSQAQGNLDTITQRMQSAFASPWQARIVSLSDEVVGPRLHRILLVLLAAVGFVLLIACVNVANLQLIHITNRQREMSTRIALGATRRKLIQQLLMEGGLIAVVGSIAGLLIAFGVMRAVGALIPIDILGSRPFTMDGNVLVFTFCLSLLCLVIFGTVPALRVSYPALNGSLKEGSSNLSQGVQQRRLQRAVVISQVGFASVLLIAALLMVKDLYHLSLIDLGIDPHNVLTMGVSLSEIRYAGTQKQRAFFDEAINRLRGLPGVQEVGLVSFLPLQGVTWQWSFSIEGRANQTYPVNYRVVNGEYFRAMRIPLVKGRFFAQGDSPSAPDAVIINQAMAKQFWPNQDAIGQRMRMGDRTANVPWLSIVGIVADVKEVDLTGQPKPVFYVPYLQNPQSSMAFVIRTATDPSNIVSAAREQILAMDPNQPLYDIRTMEQVFSASTASSRFNVLLLSFFAGIATVLALIGIYGVIAYSVNQRSHEIGIRMALGARRAQIINMIMGQAAILVLIGLGIGLLVASGLTRFLSSLLYDVKPFDPAVFLLVLIPLFVVALLASFLPVRRAIKVDSIAALRHE
jgi:putative ABC transport system permease protein